MENKCWVGVSKGRFDKTGCYAEKIYENIKGNKGVISMDNVEYLDRNFTD
jgi:hypothetical protein